MEKSINAVENVNANSMALQTSPLPVGAEEISQELADVWEEVLHEDNGTKEIACHSSIPNVMSNSSAENVYSNQPSTFSLEVPSSFENSPLIQLEDLLEVADHRSTPVNLELSVPTPMPSPTNAHSICDSAFCPNLVDNCSVITSSFSPSNSPAISHSSNRTVTPKTTRKRQRCPKGWTDLKRKCLKNLDQEKESFQQHQTNKKIARDLKNHDKKEAEESNGNIVTAVFDFEKVLQCPHGNINIFYYKRKLSSFNFTVFDMGKRKAICYMWDESVAKRGANEKGHTQNEGDSVHSVIERASQTKTIFTPHEWRLLVRWAKNEGEPYVVRNVTQNDVFDFKSLVNNKIWMKDIQGKKINWSNIREVHADGSDPNKLFFKYDLTQPDYNILVIRGNTRNSVQTELNPAYSGPIMVSAAKYKDLMDMCRSEVIPIEYHSYFNSLPHHTTVDASEETDSDLSE
ncbi:hypothetical protein PYW08_016685 [Mythimna loreyi]|uniref:Uncharacterized protein n=1 Tax=Mythimna loreyi TaxID=667449 RepID=A0ACC2QZU9_9NEOP|nr:hypothetical protein PYW08_016685 [Mythimna loreyi]